MTSVTEKQFMAYVRSIDKSLGRIATALENMQEQQGTKTYEGTDDDGNDIYVWHPGRTVKEVNIHIDNDEYDGCLRVAQPIDHDDLK